MKRDEHVQKNRRAYPMDKVTTEKTESENVVAESASAQQVVAEKAVVEKAAEEKEAIAKSAVANVAVEEVAAKTNSSAKTITAKQVDLGVSSKSLRAEEVHANTGDGAEGCNKGGRDRRGTSDQEEGDC